MEQKNQGQEASGQIENAQPKDALKTDTGDQITIVEEKITTVNGSTSVRKYTKGRMLGKGGFAKCYEFENLDNGRKSAAKLILKNSLTKSRAKQKLLSEIKIHRSLQHLHVVKFEHVFEDSESVYILLELCSNQTLNELLKKRKRLHELEVRVYTTQIINALKYLHANKIIHRDLKLGNLFLNDKMEIKLGDFGLAAKLEFDGEKRRTICGTPNYIAPEILDNKIGHSYEVDVWSLGVIVYTLIIGKPPFETSDVKTTYKKIRMNQYIFPEHVPISDDARNFIVKILNLDPSRRPTLDEMLDHPFLNYGVQLPKALPISTIACPPSTSYISQFIPPQKGTTGMMTSTSSNKIGMNTEKLMTNNDKPVTPKTGFEKNQTVSNLQQPYGMTSGFNGSMNPNNQGMLATQQKDYKMETTKPFGLKGLETVTSNTNFNATGTISNFSNPKSARSEVYVKKWVDYSTKYGLGYILSNGSTGVFFNDSTKIVFDPNSTYFEYIERKPPSKMEETRTCTLTNYPKELQKKVVLLQHFKSHLEGEAGGKEIQPELDEESKKIGMVYVKKWLKTKHAIMFRLNNKIVQVNFTDKTEIILSSEQKLVTYVGKKRRKKSISIGNCYG